MEISIVRKKNKYNIYQENQKKLEIKIKYNNNLKTYNFFKKKYNLRFKNKIFLRTKRINDIIILLNNISKYVGTIYLVKFSNS